MFEFFVQDKFKEVLATLKRMEKNMSSQEAELNTILAAIKQGQADNTAAFAETETGVARLIEIVSTPGVDLTDENAEFAQVRDALLENVARVNETNAAIDAALNPTPPA